jgi:hypothetical protein
VTDFDYDMVDREEEMCILPMVAAILASTVLAFTSSSAAETQHQLDLNSKQSFELAKKRNNRLYTRRKKKSDFK